jgi:hypothetical protein
MYLFKARQVAQAEVDQALERHGLTMDEVRAFLAKNPNIGGPLFHPPHVAGSTTADLVEQVGRLAKTTRLERAGARVRAWTRAAGETVALSARVAPQHAAATVALALAEIAREKGPGIVLSLAERAKSRVAKREDVPVAAE